MLLGFHLCNDRDIKGEQDGKCARKQKHIGKDFQELSADYEHDGVADVEPDGRPEVLVLQNGGVIFQPDEIEGLGNAGPVGHAVIHAQEHDHDEEKDIQQKHGQSKRHHYSVAGPHAVFARGAAR